MGFVRLYFHRKTVKGSQETSKCFVGWDVELERWRGSLFICVSFIIYFITTAEYRQHKICQFSHFSVYNYRNLHINPTISKLFSPLQIRKGSIKE